MIFIGLFYSGNLINWFVKIFLSFLIICMIGCKSSHDERNVKTYDTGHSSALVVENLKGKWIYAGPKTVECPNTLCFDSKRNSYYIINYCTGKKPGFIIEEGVYNYSEPERVLNFSQRKFVGNLFFYNNSENLTIYLKELNSDTLKICFDKLVDCEIELYKKSEL